MTRILFIVLLLVGASSVRIADAAGLLWPVDCTLSGTCASVGYPDVNNDGLAYNCTKPGYKGHQGSDFGITWAQMDAGVDVYAAGDGVVLWVFDGKYDRCPSSHADCQPSGYTRCTETGNYCGTGTCCCYWCFYGGNVVVIKHSNVEGVFATRYDHLKKDSILVKAGDTVTAGQKIAQVGSAGQSSGPHLHFEVWGTGYYELTEPWMGICGPNKTKSLWAHLIPWAPNVPAVGFIAELVLVAAMGVLFTRLGANYSRKR